MNQGTVNKSLSLATLALGIRILKTADRVTMSEPSVKVYVCEEVREVRRLHQDLFTDQFRQLPIEEQLDRQAGRIFEAHGAGNSAVATHIKCWHPELVGLPAEEIMRSDFTLADARLTIAREYGFTAWSDVQKQGLEPPDAEFEFAVDALVDGDVERLRQLLDGKPSLVRERSRFGHRATLLHYVGSNGIETHRQRVPLNLADVTRLLIEAGADVNATAEIYGGSTPIALLTSSAHPSQAGVLDEVLQILLDAGASRNS